jgi:hypothetical protein
LIIRIAWKTQTNFKSLFLTDFCQCFLLHYHNGFFMYLQLTQTYLHPLSLSPPGWTIQNLRYT